ncbi:MAG TPA: hypothetical protein VGW10_00240, partial [Solirubrobacteraceae bacterium]|nr:hypothetical protein [Solirubrobacteraceae bacterium]
MRRPVALAAAVTLLAAAAPADARRASPKPVRFAAKCVAKKRAACRPAPRPNGWRPAPARTSAPAVAPAD